MQACGIVNTYFQRITFKLLGEEKNTVEKVEQL